MKRFLVLLCVIAVIFCTGCNNDNPDVSTPPTTTNPTENSCETKYSVLVLDDMGNPVPEGVIVNFLQNGNMVAMQSVNASGVAEKSLPTGNYTVELAFTDPNASYGFTAAAVTADAPSVSMTLTGYVACRPLIVDGQEFTAYYVSDGDTIVKLESGKRNYFLFLPTQAGTYEFSASEGATIGYFGSTFFVQPENLGKPSDKGFTVSISAGMVTEDATGAMVLGVDGDIDSATITIERIGDPEKTLADYPWDVYQPTTELQDYILPENVTIVDFDLCASSDAYRLVFNENDGFYHLSDINGPLVFCKLGVDSAYIDSIQTILDSSGVSCYFFDEDGNFVKKETYNECLLQYVEHMDAKSGLYPLTNDLVYIIQQRGNFVGWWDPDGESYLFVDENGMPIPGINHDIAWMFLLCYGEEEPEATEPPATEPPATEPPATEPEPTEPEDNFTVGEDSGEKVELYYYQISKTMKSEAAVKAGQFVTYDFYRLGDIVLTIHSDTAYLIFDDQVILPENGVIQFEMVYEGNYYPCTVAIGNSGNEDALFALEFSIIPGTINAPVSLELGTFVTETRDGDEQGFYYTFTATKNGTLSISFDGLDVDANCQITMTNQYTYVQTAASNGTCAIEVNAGDVVQIVIAVDDGNYSFPAATVKATASFQ